MADFCGFRGAAESRFSAYCRFLADRSNERPVGRLTIHAKLFDRHAISSIIALPHAGVASVRVATELEGSLRMGIGEAMLFTSFWLVYIFVERGVSMAAPMWQWSAVETAAAIRDGRVTAEAVVQAHIDRMHAANPALNAVVVDLSAQAIEAARAADRAKGARRRSASSTACPSPSRSISTSKGRPIPTASSHSRTTSRRAIRR